jgi:DNA-binding CsgD family transcriptional regulator
VLEDVSAVTDAAYASLVTLRGGVLRYTGTAGALQLIESYLPVQERYPNPRLAPGIAMQDTGVVTEFDLVTPEQMKTDPFYNEVLYPNGGGWAIGSFHTLMTGETVLMSAERAFERGPYSQQHVKRIERLRPHYARSAMISARLNLERARVMADVFQLIELPAAVLQTGGRIIAANQLFERLVPSGFEDRGGGIRAVDGAADALLQVALDWRGAGPLPVMSIPVAGHGDRPAKVIHLLPVRGAAHDIFAGAATVLLVTEVVPLAIPGAELLQGLFDLTPAEARIARRIASGHSVKAIASELRLSANTVRNQLATVLNKTGLHRQTELALLLAGLAPPRGR